MAIDDSTDYTLTGAQVKDLAARIKAGGSGMIVYVDASFESPSSITNVFSDSGLTTVADWEDMADVILAGGTVIAVYDNGSNKHQYVELVSVTVNDNIPFGKRFAGVISSNVGEGSKPLTIFLYYDDGIAAPRWFAEGSSLPTVNDATLTIQKNGTDVATFTANSSTNATANISVPTQFSDLSGTVSTSQIADGAITSAKLAGFSTANTTDTWVPVASSGNLQHRVIKAFNSDGSIPTSAIADSAVTTAKINNAAVTSAKIDWGNCRTFGTGTLNSTYFSSGTVQWVKLGNMVFVVGFDMALKTSPPNNSWTTYAISNLPKAASSIGNYKFNATRYGTNNLNLTLAIRADATGLYFHYTAGTQTGTFNLLAVYAAA